MERAWENNFRKVDPYVPGEQPKTTNIIKLNTNENPYPPAPEVLSAALKDDYNLLKLYPDYQSTKLVDALAEKYGVESENIFVGVGSDDVISMIFLALFNSKKPIFFPDITYSFYSVWADVYRIPYKKIPLNDDFMIEAKDYYEENGGVIFANPNAPTSIYQDLDFIEDVLKHNQDVVVVVDEAYIDFGGKSAISLLEKYENLVVVRTFSKSMSMAGMRIGFAIAGERIIKAINDVKYSVNSYTLNRPSIELGAIAVKNSAYYEEITEKVVNTRENAIKVLTEMGFSCLPSSTNFIFAKHNRMHGQEIFDALRERNIIVRHFSSARIDEYLRITVGTDEQMEKLFAALSEILK